MSSLPALTVVAPRVWRDFSQLAAEALATGVVFSMLVALAVFVIAREPRYVAPMASAAASASSPVAAEPAEI